MTASKRWFVGTATMAYRPETQLSDLLELAADLERMATLLQDLGYELVAGFAGDRSSASVGVLVSARSYQRAGVGAFTEAFIKAVHHSSWGVDLARNWDGGIVNLLRALRPAISPA